MINRCLWDIREGSAKKLREGRYVPESFGHPAKMSVELCRALLETYTLPGNTVLDPMVGVGTTAVEGMLMGRNIIGVELEKPWAALARLNQAHALWEAVFTHGKERGWYGATGGIVCGDARLLAGLLAEACVFSPPYAGTNHPMGRCDPSIQRKYAYDCSVSRDPDNIANLAFGSVLQKAAPLEDETAASVDSVVFSPPFGEANRGGSPAYLSDKSLPGWNANGHFKNGKTLQVSQDPNNIDNTKIQPKDLESGGRYAPIVGGLSGEVTAERRVDAALLSPPYASRLGEGAGWVRTAGWGGGSLRAIAAEGYTADHRASDLDNIGNLRIDSALLSPPYANRYEQRSGTMPNGDPRNTHSYSEGPPSAEQIGATQNRKSYLDAMLAVYQAIYRVLKPGGIMTLVVKDFVSQRKRIPLGNLTVDLCRQVGFTFRPCPEQCGHPWMHTHLCPLNNPSFWVRNASQKWDVWNAARPMLERLAEPMTNPYPLEEAILVFSR